MFRETQRTENLDFKANISRMSLRAKKNPRSEPEKDGGCCPQKYENYTLISWPQYRDSVAPAMSNAGKEEEVVERERGGKKSKKTRKLRMIV